MRKREILFALALLCAACNSSEERNMSRRVEAFARICEYTPAPGQFINEPVSGYDGVTTAAEACAYAERRLRGGEYVSLGGWGGYLVAAFAEPVENSGGYDLLIGGNAFSGSSEPGVVWVMRDDNGNGRPDDRWYQLRGGCFDRSVQGYEVTYVRPAQERSAIDWRDGMGGSGRIERMDEHTQASYWPAWIDASEQVYTGVRLPDNVEMIDGLWVLQAFSWGYVDNCSKTDMASGANRLRISDAVDPDGTPVQLDRIDFVKVQTGVNRQVPLIGEISTEVCSIGCYRTVTE